MAAPPADAKKTASGLALKVLTPGTGKDHPGPEDKVKVHYTGWTTDGKMFDSSVQRGEPASFKVNGVIKGWTEGLQLMTTGEKARFWIPGKLAYGDTPAAARDARGHAGVRRRAARGDGGSQAARRYRPTSRLRRRTPRRPNRVSLTGCSKKGNGTRHPTATDHVEGALLWLDDRRQDVRQLGRSRRAHHVLALNGVIKGWTEGVQLMVEGEKTRFWIPGNSPTVRIPAPARPPACWCSTSSCSVLSRRRPQRALVSSAG